MATRANTARVSLALWMIVAGVNPGALADEDHHAPAVFGLRFSPDGKWLAAAGGSSDEGGPIAIWRVSDWRLHVSHFEETGGMDVAFSPDGRLLAYGTRSPNAGVIDVPRGGLLRLVEAHSGSVFSVAFTPDGHRLVTAGSDHLIKLWNVETWQLERTLEGHTDGLDSIAVSPDGTKLLSGASDHTARMWDLMTGKVTHTFRPSELIVRRVAFSRDGRFFMTSRFDGRVRVRETSTGQLRAMLQGGSDSSDLTADNRWLATSGMGNTAFVHHVNLRRPDPAETQRIDEMIRRFTDDDIQVRDAAAKAIEEIGLIAEPRLRGAMNSEDAEVRIRARRLRRRVMAPEPVARLKGHRGEVEVVCFSPDGRLLATGCRGGDIKVWQVPSFEEIITLRAPGPRPEGATLGGPARRF